jgi:hypothetical protein
MSATIGDTLPFAMGVALSPLPIIAVILILLSRRAKRNGPAFLLGWVLGLATAEGIVLVIVGPVGLLPGGGPSTLVALLKLVLGVLLIALGIRQWRRRPKAGEMPSVPGWMTSIDSFTATKTLGLAVLLSSGGNVALILAAAVGIARAKLNVGEQLGALATFILIGSLTVATIVLYHVVQGEKAVKHLSGWKDWLVTNNATVMVVTLLLVGVLLIDKGIGGLDLFG